MSFNDEGFVTAKELDEQTTITTEAVEVVEEAPVEPTVKVNVETAVAPVTNTDGQLADFEILNPTIPMRDKVAVATDVANCLSEVIRSQGLVKKGLNKKEPEKEYVLIDGWEILGSMLGIVPVSRIVDEITNNQGRAVGYRARAFLYRNPIVENGEIVGGDLIATAEARADKSGFQKDMFAIESMAQTRALSKSYRMALGWIMKMAKFEPTPAEEMPLFEKKGKNE